MPGCPALAGIDLNAVPVARSIGRSGCPALAGIDRYLRSSPLGTSQLRGCPALAGIDR